jgi:peptidoglycan hydrolase-like protein with peptidoglycan-binding domain
MGELIGVDYASVDQNVAPGFPQARAAGVRFAIVRAIYGRGFNGRLEPYRDPCWARDKDAIRAAGLKRGAYLFLCFDKTGATTPTPEAQAQAYCDYVGLLPYQDFVPMIDVEEASDTLSPDQMYAWVMRAANVLAAHFGAWPGMYTSNRVWQENLAGHAAGALISSPLWLAKPWPWAINAPAHLDGAPAYQPTTIPEFGDATYWWIYQYQGDARGVPGFSSTCDLNRFHVVRRGDQGGIVTWVQRRVGTPIDGVFGPATENAVKAVQATHGLTVDGIVGPDTFAALAWTRTS